MRPLLMAGSMIVTLALISYSIGVITEQRKKRMTKKVLAFLTIGLTFDITATICMILGSPNSPFTFHGFLGYSALLAMIIETLGAYRFYLGNGSETIVSKKFDRYSLYSYIWWITAYITGGLLVALH